MNIVEKHVDELIPYENNPRHNEDAVKFVKASIQQFGFKVPIVIDPDNTIIAGHTRVLAAKELGMDTVPCVVADDLTEEQIKAFRLADNKVSEASGWDWDKLDQKLMALSGLDIDMSSFGFDVDSALEAAASDDNSAIDSFFEVAPDTPEPESEKHEAKSSDKKTVTCPHCGAVFQV